jgi:hypothetical protein
MMNNNPTAAQYAAMNRAFHYFNERLFGAELPDCLITLQRKASTYGYFAGGRFGSADGQVVTDEIAMNPTHFKDRSAREILSTLAHEMAHLWQHHFGNVSRGGYHNKEWALKMRSIGLIPSDTGQVGGKDTGQRMTHYIDDGGLFNRYCTELLGTGFTLPYVELWAETAKGKAKNKTKFICCECGSAAWGKPELRIICAECDVEMVVDL